MNTTPIDRAIARHVRVLAILTILATMVLLTIGGLVTSFKAGMTDPVWPTEPWFLAVNGKTYFQEEHAGFLLEHTHRLAGFVVGALMSVLAIAAWVSGPGKLARVVPIILTVALLGAYGDLHRRLMGVVEARKAGDLIAYPEVLIAITMTLACLLFLFSWLHLRSMQPGRWIRFLCSLLLIGVMVQGLFGGTRVLFDQLRGYSTTLGQELAAVHGCFAQVVFATMLVIPILSARFYQPAPLELNHRARLGKLALALMAVTFLQLVWAVVIRHLPDTAIAQRLHILTAFVVFGIASVLILRILNEASSKARYRLESSALMILLTLQIVLGVEAWMGKYAAQGPQGLIPPYLRDPTLMSAGIRSLHQLIGTGILALATVLTVRIWRRLPKAVRMPESDQASSSVERKPMLTPIPV